MIQDIMRELYCIKLLVHSWHPQLSYPFRKEKKKKNLIWGFKICRYYNNAYYAKVGGISTTEMNFLEVDFLFGLGFHLNVTPTTFHTYCSYLQREMLLQPTIKLEESSLMYMGKSAKLHLCFNEDESSQQQLAV